MKIKKIVKSVLVQLSKNILINNVNRTKHDKSALLVYITRPFVKKETKPVHPNYFQALIISKVLNELGYNVDVIYSEFTRNINVQKYDVVFGMGNGYTKISEKCNANCKKIYLSTGTCFTVANQEELIRWINLCNRKKGFIGTDRIEKVNDPIKAIVAFYQADAILSVGETDWVLNSFRRINPNVYSIGTLPLINDKIQNYERQIELSRNGFLFLCGKGCIHKGLDIIVETFSKRNLNLYICGDVEEEFTNVYKEELSNGNIHLNGFVNINSDKFASICSKCCFIVNMSCSEGCCTSVLTGMATGLIPIITQAEGINITDEIGFLLNNANQKELDTCLDFIEKMEITDIEKKMKCAKETIRKNYSIEACETKLRKCLNEIL